MARKRFAGSAQKVAKQARKAAKRGGVTSPGAPVARAIGGVTPKPGRALGVKKGPASPRAAFRPPGGGIIPAGSRPNPGGGIRPVGVTPKNPGVKKAIKKSPFTSRRVP